MTRSSNGHGARVPWFLGALVALSLAVVIPIHLNHPSSAASNAAHAGLRTAHHTVIDQIGSRLRARIDRASRMAAPKTIAAAVLFTSVVPDALARATAAPPRVHRLRHMRIAPGQADDGEPPSRIASLRV